jgi:hypothetical protein
VKIECGKYYAEINLFPVSEQEHRKNAAFCAEDEL